MAFTPTDNDEFKDALAYYFSTGTDPAGGSLAGLEGSIGRYVGYLHTDITTTFVAAVRNKIGTWVVTAVTDMSEAFKDKTTFNEDISGWTVSAVQNMSSMFEGASAFDCDISGWTVSAVQNMSSMFKDASAFNNNNVALNGWERPPATGGVLESTLATVKDMSSMFEGASAFNCDISGWTVSAVQNMSSMFKDAAAFDKDISGWDVSKVTTMASMFKDASAFNNNNVALNAWTVSAVLDMSSMFEGASIFDKDISIWDVSNVKDMSSMFKDAADFDKEIWRWELNLIDPDLTDMFNGATAMITRYGSYDGFAASPNKIFFKSVFQPADKAALVAAIDYYLGGATRPANYAKHQHGSNGGTLWNSFINDWDTSQVKDMSNLFNHASRNAFNRDISRWNVGNVTNMTSMFEGTTAFNQDISRWNVSKVTTMAGMFKAPLGVTSVFNNGSVAGQALNSLNDWDVSNVEDMSSMFNRAGVFNQRIDRWNVKKVTTFQNMFNNAIAFKDLGIRYWDVSVNATKNNGGHIENSGFDNMFNGATGLDMTNALYNFIFSPASPTTPLEPNEFFFIKRFQPANKQQLINALAHFCTRSASAPLGTRPYDISLTRGPTGVDAEMKNINFWDTSKITDMSSLYSGFDTILNNAVTALTITAAEKTIAENEFNNIDFSLWNVENVTNMQSMFENATGFDKDISNWNVSRVTNMKNMFKDAAAFDSALNGWERAAASGVSASTLVNVTNMQSMFEGADFFDQDIGNWNVSNVENMSFMFKQALVFNKDIKAWCVSSVTNMDQMFKEAQHFNNDDVSLNNWERAAGDGVVASTVGNVTNMSSMFEGAIAFNKDINTWNVSAVKDMSKMFMGIKGEGLDVDVTITADDPTIANITVTDGGSGYKVGNIITFAAVGDGTGGVSYNSFTYTLEAGDFDDQATGVLSVGILSGTPPTIQNGVAGTTANAAHTVTDATTGLPAAINNAFNKDISAWNVSSVDDSGNGMSEMFAYSNFNNGGASLNGWETGAGTVASVTNMESMFEGAILFDQNIGAWNVGKVQNMNSMFEGAILFDKNISTWDVSSVGNMSSMFKDAAAYDNDGASLNGWERVAGVGGATSTSTVASVTNMESMFESATAFNQDISEWNVSGVTGATHMKNMFKNAIAFDQPIYKWTLNATAPNVTDMFSGASAMAVTYGAPGAEYDGWNAATPSLAPRSFFTTVFAPTNMTDLTDAINYYMTGASQPVNYSDHIHGRHGVAASKDNINNWDVSLVTEMSAIFGPVGARLNGFDGKISDWDVSAVTDMSGMFKDLTSFNQDISNWNVSQVTNMASMFEGASAFNSAIQNWDVSLVENMLSMFKDTATFNHPLAGWERKAGGGLSASSLSNVNEFGRMFDGSVFNHPIGNWDTGSSTNFFMMFHNNKVFNHPIGNWDTNKVTTMAGMFDASAFNQPIGGWDTSNVEFMNSMFGASAFNQPIGGWDTSKVTDMNNMFHTSSFNQDISNWNVGAVTNMARMFEAADNFNNGGNSLNGWERVAGVDGATSTSTVGNVTNMNSMFKNASVFNQNIHSWTPEKVTNMNSMFENAVAFNRNIRKWVLKAATPTTVVMFNGATAINERFKNKIIIKHCIAKEVSGGGPQWLDNIGHFYVSALDASNNLDPKLFFVNHSNWGNNGGTASDAYRDIIKDAIIAARGGPDQNKIDGDLAIDTVASGDANDPPTALVATGTTGVNFDFTNFTLANTKETHTLIIKARWDQHLDSITNGKYHITNERFKPDAAVGTDAEKLAANKAALQKALQYRELSNLGTPSQGSITDLNITLKDGGANHQIGDTINIVANTGALFGYSEHGATQAVALQAKHFRAPLNGNLTVLDTNGDTAGGTVHIKSNISLQDSAVVPANELYIRAYNNTSNPGAWHVLSGGNIKVEVTSDTSAKIIITADVLASILAGDYLSIKHDVTNKAFNTFTYTLQTSDFEVPSNTTRADSYIATGTIAGVTISGGVTATTLPYTIPADQVTVTPVIARSINKPVFKLKLDGSDQIELVLVSAGSPLDPGDQITINGTESGTKHFDDFSFKIKYSYVQTTAVGAITNLDGLSFTQTATEKLENKIGETRRAAADTPAAAATTTATMAAGTAAGRTADPITNATVYVEVRIPEIAAANANFDETLHIGKGDGVGETSLEDKLIDHWDVTTVTDMSDLFCDNHLLAFNQDIGQWDVNAVTNMSGMFKGYYEWTPRTDQGATEHDKGVLTAVDREDGEKKTTALVFGRFNKDISEWQINTTDNVDMSSMFAFNDPESGTSSEIGAWNVSAVTDMSKMFQLNRSFNQDISKWDVSAVTDMSSMFEFAFTFNQDISKWNVGAVTDMSRMFKMGDVQGVAFAGGLKMAFNQDISNWDVSSVTNFDEMLELTLEVDSGARKIDYAYDLGKWDIEDAVDPLTKAGNLQTFLGDSSKSPGGATMNKKVGEVLRYRPAGNAEFNSAITYYFDTTAARPARYSADIHGDHAALTALPKALIKHWDVSAVSVMSNTFQTTATKPTFNQDIGDWDVSNVNNMSGMFSKGAGGADPTFDKDISAWNVGAVTDMSSMFKENTAFDKPIGGWNVGAVTDMSSMFEGATGFNNDISGWDVSLVENMSSMFKDASVFNNNNIALNGWERAAGGGGVVASTVGKVQDMSSMFEGAIAFNKDINTWNVSAVKDMSKMFMGIKGEGLVVNVTITADPTIANITVVTAGTGYEVGDVITFAAVGDGTTAGDYDEFSYTLLAGDFHDTVTDVLNLNALTGTTSTIENGVAGTTNSAVHTVTDGTTGLPAAINNAFNKDISAWNVSSVDDSGNGMSEMFAYSNFDQPIYKWTLNATAPNADNMFNGATVMHNSYGTTSPAAYDGFDNTPSTTGVSFFTTVFAPANKTNLQAALKYYMGVAGATKPDNYSDHIHGHKTAHGGAFAANINNWDVSAVTDMSDLFDQDGIRDFNQNISGWDVSNVTNMSGMFKGCTDFDQPIGNWNTAIVTNMSSMFEGASAFNSAIQDWDVSQVDDMSAMFKGASAFVQQLGGWERQPGSGLNASSLSNVRIMSRMFELAFKFNQDITGWDVSNVRNMINMFHGASAFNHPIGGWKTTRVTNMTGMFMGASAFNQPIGGWDTRNVMNMSGMFQYALAFNQPIGGWNTANVQDMAVMFEFASAFNHPIGSWNTASVMNMSGMFQYALAFNQPIGGWDTSNVEFMDFMFKKATAFNQDISNWVVSRLGTGIYGGGMGSMFFGATAFNKPIGGWNVGKVSSMESMFENAIAFNQDISGWDVSSVQDMSSMFKDARNFNRNLSNWQRTADGPVAASSLGTVVNMESMFENALTFNQDISGWNVSAVTNMSSMFKNAVSFSEDISKWIFKETLESAINLSSMFEKAINFDGRINTNYLTTPGAIAWNLGKVTNMERMFFGASKFNRYIGNWNTSSVTNMKKMFACAPKFNQDISTKMNVAELNKNNSSELFGGITAYDAWNVSAVTNMESMFNAQLPSATVGEYSSFGDGTAFTKLIKNWTPTSVKTMESMFENAQSFSSYIRGWQIIKTAAAAGGTGLGVDGATNVKNMFENATKMITDYNYLDDSELSTKSYYIFNVVKYNGPDPDEFFNHVKYQPTNAQFIEALYYYFGHGTIVGITKPAHYPDDGGRYFETSGRSRTNSLRSALIGDWDVRAVTDMSEAFYSSNTGGRWETHHTVSLPPTLVALTKEFDEDISEWDVRNVQNMESMFEQAFRFNQDITGWNVSSVTNMKRMFHGDPSGAFTDFVQDIRKWKLKSTIGASAGSAHSTLSLLQQGLDEMFNYSDFCKKYKHFEGLVINKSGFDVLEDVGFDFKKIPLADVSFTPPAVKTTYTTGAAHVNTNLSKTSTLLGLSTMSVPNVYNTASTAGGGVGMIRTAKEFFLGDEYGRFQPKKKAELLKAIAFHKHHSELTNKALLKNDHVTFQYDSLRTGDNWIWARVSAPYGYTNDIGTWDISYSATVGGPSIITDLSSCFANNDVINTVTNHDIQTSWVLHNKTERTAVRVGNSIYDNKPAVTSGGTDYYKAWDVSKIANMQYTFYKAINFNQTLSHWDVSSVTNMKSMFEGASAFNSDISLWNVNSVQYMSSMFKGATIFNKDIYTAVVNHGPAPAPTPYAAWNPAACTDMSSMFEGARAFDCDIGNWNINSVTKMPSMFKNALAFNQNIATKGIHKLAIFEDEEWQPNQINTADTRFDNSAYAASGGGLDTAKTGKTGNYLAWDTRNVNDMSKMFKGASAFDDDNNSWSISNWNTMRLGNMEEMFMDATKFNQDIRAWSIGIDFDITSSSGIPKGSLDWNKNVFSGATAMKAGYKRQDGWNGGSPKLSFFNRVYTPASAEELKRAVNHYLNKDHGIAGGVDATNTHAVHPIIYNTGYKSKINTVHTNLQLLLTGADGLSYQKDIDTPFKVKTYEVDGTIQFTNTKHSLTTAPVTVASGDSLRKLALAVFDEYFPSSDLNIYLLGDETVAGVDVDGAFNEGGISLAQDAVSYAHTFLNRNKVLPDLNATGGVTNDHIELITVAMNGFIVPTYDANTMTETDLMNNVKYAALRCYVSVLEYAAYHASTGISRVGKGNVDLYQLSELATRIALLYLSKHVRVPNFINTPKNALSYSSKLKVLADINGDWLFQNHIMRHKKYIDVQNLLKDVSDQGSLLATNPGKYNMYLGNQFGAVKIGTTHKEVLLSSTKLTEIVKQGVSNVSADALPDSLQTFNFVHNEMRTPKEVAARLEKRNMRYRAESKLGNMLHEIVVGSLGTIIENKLGKKYVASIYDSNNNASVVINAFSNIVRTVNKLYWRRINVLVAKYWLRVMMHGSLTHIYFDDAIDATFDEAHREATMSKFREAAETDYIPYIAKEFGLNEYELMTTESLHYIFRDEQGHYGWSDMPELIDFSKVLDPYKTVEEYGSANPAENAANYISILLNLSWGYFRDGNTDFDRLNSTVFRTPEQIRTLHSMVEEGDEQEYATASKTAEEKLETKARIIAKAAANIRSGLNLFNYLASSAETVELNRQLNKDKPSIYDHIVDEMISRGANGQNDSYVTVNQNSLDEYLLLSNNDILSEYNELRIIVNDIETHKTATLSDINKYYTQFENKLISMDAKQKAYDTTLSYPSPHDNYYFDMEFSYRPIASGLGRAAAGHMTSKSTLITNFTTAVSGAKDYLDNTSNLNVDSYSSLPPLIIDEHESISNDLKDLINNKLGWTSSGTIRWDPVSSVLLSGTIYSNSITGHFNARAAAFAMAGNDENEAATVTGSASTYYSTLKTQIANGTKNESSGVEKAAAQAAKDNILFKVRQDIISDNNAFVIKNAPLLSDETESSILDLVALKYDFVTVGTYTKKLNDYRNYYSTIGVDDVDEAIDEIFKEKRLTKTVISLLYDKYAEKWNTPTGGGGGGDAARSAFEADALYDLINEEIWFTNNPNDPGTSTAWAGAAKSAQRTIIQGLSTSQLRNAASFDAHFFRLERDVHGDKHDDTLVVTSPDKIDDLITDLTNIRDSIGTTLPPNPSYETVKTNLQNIITKINLIEEISVTNSTPTTATYTFSSRDHDNSDLNPDLLVEVKDNATVIIELINLYLDEATYVEHNKNLFNYDIRYWDVSKVTDMSALFKATDTDYAAASFNEDISRWDVSNVQNMSSMFQATGVPATFDSVFNQNIGRWDVKKVTNVSNMFSNADAFNQKYIRWWSLDAAEDVSDMFKGETNLDENVDITGPPDDRVVTGDGTDIAQAPIIEGNVFFSESFAPNDKTELRKAIAYYMDPGISNKLIEIDAGLPDTYDTNIKEWDMSAFTDLIGLFTGTHYGVDFTSFNEDIGNWNVSTITDMSGMFENCGVFNQDISGWDVRAVRNMSSMFKGALSFNQDLGAPGGLDWDVSLVTNMSSMFEGATNFNGDITRWDVKDVVTMQAMFKNATSFNKALKWYTSSVTDLSFMFEGATAFNSDVQFFTDNVSTVEAMFKNATSFNKLICKGVAIIPYGGKVNFRFKVWHMGRFSSTPQRNMSNRQRPKTGVSNLVSMFEGATNFGKEWSKKDEKRMLAWNIIPNAQLTNMFKNTYIISNSATISLTKNAPNWEVVKIFNDFREVRTQFGIIADI